MAYIPSRVDGWNVPAGVFDELIPLQVAWGNTYTVAANPETRTKSFVQAKSEAKNAYIKQLRIFIKAYITYNPAVTDADRDNMGLSIHDTKPTPTPVPESTPIGEVDFSKR